ncbi:dynein heavy chain binding protein [Aureococcus anophagefferens]|nr:dynein heavy chain binding protein [Aureococcus anophagefferens]
MGVVSDALTSGIGAASRSVARAGLDREINALTAKVKARKEALGMDLFAPLDAADYVQVSTMYAAARRDVEELERDRIEAVQRSDAVDALRRSHGDREAAAALLLDPPPGIQEAQVLSVEPVHVTATLVPHTPADALPAPPKKKSVTRRLSEALRAPKKKGMEPPVCAPPESLLKHDEPLFVGFDGNDEGGVKKGDASGSQLEEMVNSMLPPREWTQTSGTWMQYVSKKTATRMDVISLQEDLDKRLLDRQARDAGICPVREDLYSQCYDELIRQITLDGPERGLLLLRVRDEIRMTIDAYKVLYDSSVAFGIRKQLQAEQGMSELEGRIAELEAENKDLENQVLELRNGVEVIEKRENEHKAVEDKKRKDEIDFPSTRASTDAFLRQLGPVGGK